MPSRPLIPIWHAASLAAGVIIAATTARAQSFGLDDNPAAPMPGLPGVIPGFGAENPFGLFAPPFFPNGLAPSPSLPGPPWAPASDGAILGPGPIVQARSPLGAYGDALSDNSAPQRTSIDTPLRLRFSVDRLTNGFVPGTLRKEFQHNQQPGDIFVSTMYFVHPGNYAGTAGKKTPLGYAGILPSIVSGGTSNTLILDDAEVGLLAGGSTPTPSGALAAEFGEGTHDNIDQYDQQTLDADGDTINDGWFYVTLYPDAANARGVMAADIFDIAPGAQENPGAPFAGAQQMGLDILDSIDALVIWDHNELGGPAFGGPGAEPGIDYALFSLAPGSKTLTQVPLALSAADVFFTDFTGRFYRYAPAIVLSIVSDTGGAPGDDGNIDALEADQCPDDINGNGRVEAQDVLHVLQRWGPCPLIIHCPWDRDRNGVVDFQDLLVLFEAWGGCS